MKRNSGDVSWEELARVKRANLFSLIPLHWRLKPAELPGIDQIPNVTQYIKGYLNPSEILISESSTVKLLNKIKSGEWTVEETVLAFSHRASLAHQLVNNNTNCLSEINFEDALRRAKSLDAYFKQTNRTVGSLHGLPITLADRFNVAGLESACGYVSWLGRVKKTSDEGVLVNRLIRLGAIVIAKTNVPQSLLLGDTSNNITGTTLNPYNREFSPGGASGGEGVLIALRGSPCGVGNEIAGSVRIPCTFNNLYGLKPSEGRLPVGGVETSLVGIPIAAGTVGLMAPDIGALDFLFRSILETCPWQNDPNVIELPWRNDKIESITSLRARPGQADGKLSFGVYFSDDRVQPSPAVTRALHKVKMALLQSGYDVIEWEPPSHSEGTEILFRILGSTSGQAIRSAIDASGEPAIPQLKEWYENDQVPESSTLDFWELCNKLLQFRSQYHEYWISTSKKTRSAREVDGVILPVMPQTVLREGGVRYYGYTAVVNALDYSAAAFPVLFGDGNIDTSFENFQPLSETDESVHSSLGQDSLHGAPVGLQVMSQRLQEERVLGLLGAISAALEAYELSFNTGFT